jgi:hypothetical protein
MEKLTLTLNISYSFYRLKRQMNLVTLKLQYDAISESMPSCSDKITLISKTFYQNDN